MSTRQPRSDQNRAPPLVTLVSSKYMQVSFCKEVQSIVYVNGAPVLSMGKACVVDTYGAAEEAVSYRNESSRMDSVLRFLDNVISEGVGFETA